MPEDKQDTSAEETILAPDMPPPPATQRFDAASPVVAIAKGHVALQFALTGIRVLETEQAKDALSILADLMSQPLSMVIVDERFRHSLPEAFEEKIAKHEGKPLVVFCPSFEDENIDVEAELAKELKRTIGYEIRLD